jgi:hypothetical protein
MRRVYAAGCGSAPAISLARTNTASSMAGVSFPVNVFCWLGWKDPRRENGPTVASAR